MKIRRNCCVLFVILLASFVLYGCENFVLYTSGDGPGAKKGEKIATVDGVDITVDEFNRELLNLPDYLKPLVQTPEGRKEFLDNLITRELIVKEASSKGIENNPEIKSRINIVKKGLLVDAFLRQYIEEKAKVTDKEMEELYKKDPSRFGTGEKIRVSHILVNSEKEANEVLAKINKGEDFAKLAKAKSIDPGTKDAGGDLGYFGKGQMDPNFEKAAFGLKKTGEVSGLVKTQFGFHIIKLVDRKSSETKPFEAVREDVKRKVIQDRQKEVFDKLVKELKAKASISINEAALKGGTGGSDSIPEQKLPGLPSKGK